MNKPLPQHLLEQLAAGALDPARSASLIDAMSDDDRARLDALLLANDQFFEAYPAQVMVPRLMRRALSAPAPKAPSRAPRYALAIAMTTALLAIGALAITRAQSPDAALAHHTPEATPALNPQPAPLQPAASARPLAPPISEETPKTLQTPEMPQAPKAPVPPTAPTPPTPPIKPQPLIASDPVSGGLDMAFQLGETRYILARELQRVSIEDSATLRAQASGSDRVALTGTAVGLTTLRLVTKSQERTLYIRVAPATPQDVIDAAKREGKLTLSGDCRAQLKAASVALRLTISGRGEVLTAVGDDQPEGGDAVPACVIAQAQLWRFAPAERAPTTIAKLTLTP